MQYPAESPARHLPYTKPAKNNKKPVFHKEQSKQLRAQKDLSATPFAFNKHSPDLMRDEEEKTTTVHELLVLHTEEMEQQQNSFC